MVQETTEKGEEKEEEYLGSFKAHQRKRRVQNPNPRHYPIAKVEGGGEGGENIVVVVVNGGGDIGSAEIGG